MEIQIREICKNCNGEKVIWDSAWREFNELVNKHPDWEFKQEHDYGYNRKGARIWKSWLEDKEGNRYDAPTGPEEYDCEECNGTGKATYWVTLEEIAPYLEEAIRNIHAR